MRLLAAALLVLLLGAAPALGAERPVGAWEPGAAPTPPVSAVIGPRAMELANGRFVVPTGGVADQSRWSLAVHLVLDGGQTDRIISTGDGSGGLHWDGARLAWLEDDGTEVMHVTVPTGVHSIVLVRAPGEPVRIYLDRAQSLTVPAADDQVQADSVQVEPAGLQRVRLFSAALSAGDVAGLDSWDTTAPDVSACDVRVSGSGATFTGTAVDAGRDDIHLSATIDGAAAATTRSAPSFTVAATGLTAGRHTLSVVATDPVAGAATTRECQFDVTPATKPDAPTTPPTPPAGAPKEQPKSDPPPAQQQQTMTVPVAPPVPVVVPKPPAPGPTRTVVPSTTPAGLATALAEAIAQVRLGGFERGGAAVPFRAAKAGSSTVSLKVGRTVVARGKQVFARPGTADVRLAVTPAGRRALKGKRAVTATLTTTFTPKGGTVAVRRATVTLRR